MNARVNLLFHWIWIEPRAVSFVYVMIRLPQFVVYVIELSTHALYAMPINR
eukprot:m.12852 g.12852  ORF g.12852 m.12852 type:complete len:51 (-) comp5872_c1_seq1:71-223(-)